MEKIKENWLYVVLCFLMCTVWFLIVDKSLS